MLDVALADQTTGDAFRHMGELTEYEILNISYNPDRTNFIIVTLSVTTPYLNAEAQELAAGSEILALQEYTKFRESGAAKSLAGRSLNDVPLSTDLVELTFLVIDDEPILYYPESCMYDDDEVPQYAFFWGRNYLFMAPMAEICCWKTLMAAARKSLNQHLGSLNCLNI